MEKIGIDIMEHAEKYYFVGINYFTRRGFLEYIKDKKSTTIVKVLKKWFKEWKYIPEQIIHDHGS